jgi:hypothetical protein
MLFLSKKFNGHPTCYMLKGLQLRNSGPIAGGGFGDVYRGEAPIKPSKNHNHLLRSGLGILRGHDVCVKTVRLFHDSEVEDLLKVLSTLNLKQLENAHP